jgi:hypothetical protein
MPGPRDVACRPRRLVPQERAAAASPAGNPQVGQHGQLPRRSLQRPSGSSAPRGRSRWADAVHARHAGPRDPHRQGSEPSLRSSRKSMGRPIPRAASRNATRGPGRIGIRAQQLPKASPRLVRARPVLVGDVVRRMTEPREARSRSIPSGRPADLARTRRMAARRTDRCRGIPATEQHAMSAPTATPSGSIAAPAPRAQCAVATLVRGLSLFRFSRVARRATTLPPPATFSQARPRTQAEQHPLVTTTLPAPTPRTSATLTR